MSRGRPENDARSSRRRRLRWAGFLLAVGFASASWDAPVLAAPDDAARVSLRSGRSYRVYGDLLVPEGAGPGIEGALTGARWPQATLFYAFDPSVTAAQRADFRQWVTQWQAGAGTRLVENAGAGNRVLVQIGSQIGCGSSVLGMVGGEQDLVIGSGENCWRSGVVLHELGHALGAIHEHQRADRDAFVRIDDHGVVEHCGQGTWDANYGILQTDVGSAYDYLSIMHYPSPAHYTCDGVDVSAVMTVLQRQPAGAPDGSQDACTTVAACQGRIGSQVLSVRDRYAMALRYGYRVEVSLAGNGSGTVQANGYRETCGPGCYLVTPGTLFKLTATPASGSIATFAGACTGRTCQFAPADNGSVQVRFTRKSSINAVISILVPWRPDAIFTNGFDPGT